ncbi:MAG TPA: hypothetical protein VK184_23500 [Nostocaceae cyanobacterium]|nr:hypothetical protein [Nostocaceae cyanobacterium]
MHSIRLLSKGELQIEDSIALFKKNLDLVLRPAIQQKLNIEFGLGEEFADRHLTIASCIFIKAKFTYCEATFYIDYCEFNTRAKSGTEFLLSVYQPDQQAGFGTDYKASYPLTEKELLIQMGIVQERCKSQSPSHLAN